MDFAYQLSAILEEYSSQGLNPAIWQDSTTIHSEVLESLQQTADDFIQQHYIPPKSVVDITLTGSNANFNWSKFSDIDLHVIVNFGQVDENRELVRDYFRLSKSTWNNDHEIKVCDHEVEIYVQDSEEAHHSTGVYSISDQRWLTEPREIAGSRPDHAAVEQKARKFIDQIEQIQTAVKQSDPNASQRAERLKDRLKRMRSAGLESAGEFSVENLAFKMLRNNGYLEKLSDLRKQAYDQTLTVDKCYD